MLLKLNANMIAFIEIQNNTTTIMFRLSSLLTNSFSINRLRNCKTIKRMTKIELEL